MKHYSDKKILSMIRLPHSLPRGVSAEEYREKILRKIKLEMARGYSFEEASRPYVSSGRGRLSKVLAPIVSLVASSAVLLSGGIWVFHHMSPQSAQAISSSQEEGNIEDMTSDEMIAIVGLDKRPEINQGDGSISDVPGARADVIMLASIPQDGSRAIVVSVPRDTNVHRPQCESYDAELDKYLSVMEPEESDVKINSVYETGGAQCLVKTLEDMTDSTITGYVETEFSTFSNVVDSLGGVEFTADAAIVDETLGVIIDSPGVYTLDGKKALDIVRARKVEGTGKSDFDRIERQKIVVSSLLEDMVKKSQESGIPEITRIVSSVLPDLRVDGISLKKALSIAKSISSMSPSSIRFVTLPIEGDLPNGNLSIDKKSAKTLFSALNNNTLLEGDDVSKKDSGDSERGEVIPISGRSYIINASSVHDARVVVIKDLLESMGARVTVSESGIGYERTTIEFDKQSINDAVTIASMYPEIDVSMVDLSESGASVINVGKNADDVFSGYNEPRVGMEVWAPLGRIVTSRDIIPEIIPTGINTDGIQTMESE